jgi:CubicO group peptidase (beta-lactamase class C family)
VAAQPSPSPWSRRSALGLLAGVPLAASGILATRAGSAGAAAGPAHPGRARPGPARPAPARPAPARPGPVPPDLLPGGGYERFLADRAGRDEFSGTVLLTRSGRTLLARSYGKANQELSIPNGPQTVFNLGSVTKVFTAVAAVHLVQRGLVSYRDTVGKHLIGFPAAIADAITVHHLLTHSSGLGDYMQLPGFDTTAHTWTSAAEVMAGSTEFVRTGETPAFTPGAGWKYSNSGYQLLGAIVEAVSGQSYYDYVRAHVLAPAGLRDTDFVSREQWRRDPRFARPYPAGPSGERTDDIDNRLFYGFPAGDAFSTAPDLDRFVRALTAERLLDPVHTRYLLGPKVPLGRPIAPPGEPVPESHFHCYGPSELIYAGQRVIWKNGGSPGVSTIVESYPDSGYVSIVLSNYSDAVAPVAAYPRRVITG